MASLNASTVAFALAGYSLLQKQSIVASSPILGSPSMSGKGRARCSAETKKVKAQEKGVTMGASLLAAATAAVTNISGPAIALVDERMSTEGVGLPFGLSNNLLGWILFGVFGFIWAFYFSYTANLEEDEESGLSL